MYYRGKGKISCNILFTGPPCSGKTTVVKAVCRYLNMHLYKVKMNLLYFNNHLNFFFNSEGKGRV